MGRKMNIRKMLLLGVIAISIIQVLLLQIIVEQPIELKEFDNLNQLEEWLLCNDVSNNTYITDTYDCEDFAIDLVNDAIQDGYAIYSMGSGMAWTRGRLMYDAYTETFYWGKELVRFVNHAYCITKINNIWYMIEPQNDMITELGVEI